MIDYILVDRTGVYWPGILPYRGRGSRHGYPSWEVAAHRAAVVTAAYAAAHGTMGGPQFAIVQRGERVGNPEAFRKRK